jgi:nitroimidazol reductase NimA-like FMN-containing flavoprotein (pyridoxamine 5'-phosphate oxidase superfamily)
MLVHQLSVQECEEFLARCTVGRLACVRDRQPYIVPITFVFAAPERCVYGFATAGQKIEWMRRNPKVCLQVDEIKDRFEWTSVVALGRYDELTRSRTAEIQRARELLDTRQSWWLPGAAKLDDGTEHHAAVFYRVVLDSISGRRALRQDAGMKRGTG